ncbi:glycosyltransferase family 4 protein [Eisenbergiella porci]|uniref:glycosyltransferase family 4 protein n=1 Tax=Eisenbergiella porci TaxID=2652274 RepID=UPI002A7FDE57|nr:glycosyltransferase [Eisenbergiella porci]
MKKKVLILNGQYLPGYKGGGPIQSCVNMVENLSDEYDFYVLCADRDYKEDKPYENVKINQWNQVGSAKVYYMSPDKQGLKGFEEVLNSTEYNVLYLNGFFSPIFTIRPLILRRLGILNNKTAKVILTPRGDFTGGCENKKLKKYSYIYAVKAIGLYRNLLWHATSEIEDQDIKEKFSKAKTFMVPNLPAKYVPKEPILKKQPGELRLVFVSRIFPKKNIKYALEVLKQIKDGRITFDIYGPMEDNEYWAECEDLIKQMPDNVKVKYCGEAEHKDIPHIFEQYHAFFFPTLGENYGHVIVEAMMNNCLCILSKGVTPWDDYIEPLSIGAKLNDQEIFVEIVNRLLKDDQKEIDSMLEFNNAYIAQKTDPEEHLRLYQKMLRESRI